MGNPVLILNPGAEDLAKSHVRAHTRTINGKTVFVHDYEDKRTRAQPRASSARSARAPVDVQLPDLDNALAEAELWWQALQGTNETAGQTKNRIAWQLEQTLKGDADFLPVMLAWNEESNPRDTVTTGDYVSDLIHVWATSSADGYPWSIAMQIAAAEEFGIQQPNMGHFNEDAKTAANDIVAKCGKGLRKFLRAQYDEAQKFLDYTSDADDYVTLYRGMHFDTKEEAEAACGELPWTYSATECVPKTDISAQPLSARTILPACAAVFAAATGQYAVFLQCRIPKSQVFSTCQTGFGCRDENEVVIMGSPSKVWITPIRGADRMLIRAPRSSTILRNMRGGVHY